MTELNSRNIIYIHINLSISFEVDVLLYFVCSISIDFKQNILVDFKKGRTKRVNSRTMKGARPPQIGGIGSLPFCSIDRTCLAKIVVHMIMSSPLYFI